MSRESILQTKLVNSIEVLMALNFELKVRVAVLMGLMYVMEFQMMEKTRELAEDYHYQYLTMFEEQVEVSVVLIIH